MLTRSRRGAARPRGIAVVVRCGIALLRRCAPLVHDPAILPRCHAIAPRCHATLPRSIASPLRGSAVKHVCMAAHMQHAVAPSHTHDSEKLRITSSAARTPDRYAPCAVLACSREVASPAKNSRRSSGRARSSRMCGEEPSALYEYDPRA